MYNYNRNMPLNYSTYDNYNNANYNTGDRFFGAGIAAPLLLGGIAGYAIGNNKQYYSYPAPYPVYYNNYYPYPYYY